MDELLTLPWERTDDSSPIASRMAAWAAREIIERRYEPGTLLTEADLANAQKASRTPAREAMLQLERWRLVRLVPKKGALVTTVTGKERKDLLSVRAMFEIDAVQAITSAAGDQSSGATGTGGFGTEPAGTTLEPLAADLRTLLDRQREALSSGRQLDFASVDYAFHARIIRSGGNAVVDEMLTTMGPRLARLTFLAITDTNGPLDDLVDEHARLTDLAERGEVEQFGQLVHAHIDASHFPHGR